MESASNAPRGARVSDIREERGTRSQVTGTAAQRRMTGPGRPRGTGGGVQLHRHTLWHNRRRALNVSRQNRMDASRRKTDDCHGDGHGLSQSYYVDCAGRESCGGHAPRAWPVGRCSAARRP
jgi:hypothetical protein